MTANLILRNCRGRNFLTHILPCLLFFVFASLSAKAQDIIYEHKVYFYDTEFANNAVTCHMWQRDEVTGADTPRSGFTWDNRPCLDFTGKKVTLDGKDYPVYVYQYNDNVPSHLLFRREKNGNRPAAQTPDLVYKDGALYNIEGLVQENFDASTLVDIAEGEHGMHNYIVYLHRGDYLRYEWTTTSYPVGTLDNVYVHVWGPSGDLLPWNFNAHPVDKYHQAESGAWDNMYSWINGPEYVPLQEYEFKYFGDEPTGILFRCSYIDYVDYGTGTGNFVEKSLWEQTPDLSFSNGALYDVERVRLVNKIDDPQLYVGKPLATGTVYCIDTDVAIDSESFYVPPTPLFVNNSEYPINISYDKAFANKYTRINGNWYPIYKYDLASDPYTQVALPQIFKVGHPSVTSRLSAPLEYRDGGVYWFGGKNVATPVYDISEIEVVDGKDLPVSESRKVTVYAHIGANQLMEKELWEVPYCMPYKRSPVLSPSDPLYNSYEFHDNRGMFPHEDEYEADGKTLMLEKYKMTEVSPGMYSYTFDYDGSVNDLIFFYYYDETELSWMVDENENPIYDPETGEQLTELVKTGKRAVAEQTASRSPYYNPTQLFDYVYDIGVDCFHQSYLTVEEYNKLCAERSANDIQSLYFVGNTAISEKGDADPVNSIRIDNDHGCFFLDFDVTDEQAASFKASTVDVPSLAKQIPEGMYNFQRGWASYNLGLIGCDFPAKREGETDEEYEARYDEWYSTHIVRPGSYGSSRQIRVQLNEAYSYNDYCQYPWRVEASEDHGIKVGRYWMVFDLNTDDQSVALLDFDPHPHCNATDITVRRETISNEMAQEIHNRDGVGLEGVKYVGLSALRDVNVASGSIRIGDTENTLIGNEGFENTYTIYLDDLPAYRCTGRPDRLEVDQLNISDNSTIAIRGRFHDKKTDRYFRTRYSYGSFDYNVESLPGPDVQHNDNQVGRYGDGTVSAVDDMTVTLPESSYTAYPDFRITSMRIDGALTDEYKVSIVHKDHPMQETQSSAWASHLGWKQGDGNHWVPFSGEGQITDQNNWAAYVKEEQHLPLSIDIENFDSKKSPNSSRQNDIVAYAEVLASYPFLVYHPVKVLDIQGAYDTPQTKAALKDEVVAPVRELKAESSKYVLVSVPLGMSLDFGNGVMTGVDNVEGDTGAEAGEAAPEYYNLQGIRVNAASLAPGIYIERRGDKTRKIYMN